MESHDDEIPTEQEECLVKQLINSNETHQRLEILIDLKNLILGSHRSKLSLYHIGLLEILNDLVNEYSLAFHSEILIEIFDCISSFAKTNEKKLVNRLIELNFIEKILHLLPSKLNSDAFYESCLRCLRSFYAPISSSFEHTKSNPSTVSRSIIKLFFDNSDSLEQCRRFLLTTQTNKILVLEILSGLCIDEERQNLITEKDLIPIVTEILLKTMSNRPTSSADDQLIGICLKLLCAISFENPWLAQCLFDTIDPETDQTLCCIVSNFLMNTHRSQRVSFYAAKFFVNLCKCNVLLSSDPYVSILSLTTLIHLFTKPLVHCQSINVHLECLHSLIYLLDGNSSLHHSALYTEQFLPQLFSFIVTPNKILKSNLDNRSIIELRAAALTLLAIFASHHTDIQKRIAEQENLIVMTIECYRSSDQGLKLAALRLFHGLSRSVDQLHTTFNETICDILLDAIKSNDLPLVKASSSAISNSILEFSTCRARLISNGILEILLSFLSHTDQELMINGIWALRNLSYLSTLKIKHDIIKGLTIDRIYALLAQTTDEKFLLCLISLLRNLFDDKDIETLLPLFNVNKLKSILHRLVEKSRSNKLRSELDTLIQNLNLTENSNTTRSSGDSMNSTCRPFAFPEYACDEMDQLDCS